MSLMDELQIGAATPNPFQGETIDRLSEAVELCERIPAEETIENPAFASVAKYDPLPTVEEIRALLYKPVLSCACNRADCNSCGPRIARRVTGTA